MVPRVGVFENCVFGAFEIGEDFVVIPAVISGGSPSVVVDCVTSDVNSTVYCASAAEAFSRSYVASVVNFTC